MHIFIRQETKADFSTVYKIHALAFEQENEANLVVALRNSNAFIPALSLIASLDNQIIGHILFTKIKIIDAQQNEFESLALAPVGVLPDFQNKGVGSQLILEGLKKAKELKYKSVIVLGHEHYYPKFGFQPASKWQIKAPFEVPNEVFMGLELEEAGLKNISGVVQYAKEFGID